MFNQTANPYKFKYLITAISGAGVPCVYLPEQPSEDKILFKKEQKFVRPEMPEAMRKEYKFWRKQIDNGNTSYVSPLAGKIAEWEDTEWERSDNGIWFWNNGNATYITGFYYWYLSSWQTYFGYPDYRETDKEITYMLQYVEEDPNCYGLILNTIRRYGKSSIMGGWITYRTTRNSGHYAGMQGEKDSKIGKFYDQMVKKPFLKLPPYYKPEYDTSSTLSSEIKFERTTKRGKAAKIEQDDDDEGTLESIVDFRPSGEAEYDGSILHSYLMEEPGKCHPAGTKVRMYDGSIKNVEEVQIGDFLRGDDNIPRKVLNIGGGYGKIYKVSTTRKADPWYINEHHILSCKTSRSWRGYRKGDVINLSLKEYLALNYHQKRHLVCYRSSVEYSHIDHELDPYFLGVWLGDGSKYGSDLACLDPEILEWLEKFTSDRNGKILKKYKNNKLNVHSISGGKITIRTILRLKNLLLNKHIPKEYLIDSKENRLKLLAGLIDTDGHREYKSNRPNQRSYEITQKLKNLAYDIKELCFSLGFYASIKEKTASMKRKDGSVYKCQVYRINIYGHELHTIPCKVERKKMPKNITTYNSKDPLVYGFSVEYDRMDNYYGFNISGNRLYLLEDYTVTHNTLTCNVNERWKIIKPCLRKGRTIRGKALLGTTVEFMDTANKGGKAYKKLFYESDFDDRQPDGRTKSGLYAAFLPGDCAYEGFYDEWGVPNREKARASLLEERESAKDDPKDLSDLIRKYPLSIKEIFYINTESCEFNATILQDRRSLLDVSTDPFFSKIDFYWENNVRFSRVLFKHNPTGGWCKVSWLPKDIDTEANLVSKKMVSGQYQYSPKNDNKFSAGIDPIDHGVVIEGKSSDDEFTSSRRSKPVLMLKSKYDTAIDGVLSHEEMIQRAKDKYPYKTNKYIVMMDSRPNDPNVLYERALMICWFFGVSLHVEAQKYSIINYFHNHNCGGFILNKYEPDWVKAKKTTTEGTPASQTIIQDYTSEIATYVEYFGHTIPFRELVEDLLLFNPRKTTEFDYAVAMGFTELSAKIRPKTKPQERVDLSQYLNVYDQNGEVCN